MSKSKTDQLYTPQVNKKGTTVRTNSQEQIKTDKRNSRSSDKTPKADIVNPEEQVPASGSGNRARSLKESPGYNRMVDSQIHELIHQKIPNYQHLEASCVCPTCLCGRCICKVKQPPKMYPRDLRSVYQQEYPWKEGDLDHGKNPSQYDSFKGDPYSLNKDSLYRQDYQAFKVEPNKDPHPREGYVRNNSPFYALTQYNRDYLPFGGVRSIAMRPFDQIANPNQSDLPHMLDTTYRNDYKKFARSGDGNLENGKYKMHINPNQPNLYMNTTYQNAYIKKEGIDSQSTQGQRPAKFNVGPSNMPFGHGDGSVYKTVYRDHYVPMELRKCPARVVLEQICDHTMTHGMDYTVPAVSQISVKK